MLLKKLELTLSWKEYGKAEIMVPEGLTLEQAIQYAKDHIDSITLPTESEYMEDTDEIIDEGEAVFVGSYYEVDKKETTCWSCGLKNRCKFAFDSQNINDDCIATILKKISMA